VAVALWNLVDPDKTGATQTIRLNFSHVHANDPVTLSWVDNEHSNTLAVYKSLGSPQYPTEEQDAKMNAATRITPETKHLDGTHLDLTLEPNALVLIEIPGSR
jgi:xylan 1,4-beta-xylosidase